MKKARPVLRIRKPKKVKASPKSTSGQHLNVRRLTGVGSLPPVSFFECPKFTTRVIHYCLALAFFPLLIFAAFGDPNWCRVTWMFQYFIYPQDQSIMNPPTGFTGEFNRWSSRGRSIHRANYSRGILHGDWFMQYSDGSRSEGAYSMGVQSGLWRRSYGDGKIELSNFSGGVLDGKHTVLSTEGKVLKEENFSGGKRDGLVRIWYQNGNPHKEVTYRSGINVGVARAWHGNGELKETIEFSDKGLAEGEMKQWHNNGQLRERGSFLAGERNGRWICWHRDGVRRWEGTYDEQGRKTGLWKMWFPSGALRCEKTYLADTSIHSEIWWHENGVKRAERIFYGNRLHGHAIEWDENGNRIAEGTYRFGAPQNGTFFVHSRGESAGRIVKYADGKLQDDAPSGQPEKAPQEKDIIDVNAIPADESDVMTSDEDETEDEELTD